MRRVAVVDIDATLWSLGAPWHEELKKINPECPKPGANGDWDFWKGYVTQEELVQCCNAVHYKQYEFKPFAHASEMVKCLRDAGYYVVIASHRCEGSCGATVRWLSENNIQYDDLRIGSNLEKKFDKADLFDEFEVEIFIDDAPKELGKAVGRGINCFTIKYDYNKHFEDDEVYFAADDKELLEAVQRYIRVDKGLRSIGL